MADQPQAPSGSLDLSKSYAARFKTQRGEFTCELHAAQAPLTVENFVNLARSGYYDGTTFHRVIPGFMAQAGDPTGTGRGGPGYTFKDEFSPSLHHDGPGVLSMANAGPGTNGSQFFITFAPTPHLDGRHTVFGRVTDGLDIVLSVRERDPGRDSNSGRPDRDHRDRRGIARPRLPSEACHTCRFRTACHGCPTRSASPRRGVSGK